MEVEHLDNAAMSALRKEVRAWASANTPSGWERQVKYDDDARRKLFKDCLHKLRNAGYLASHWPKEFGGEELPLGEQMVIRQELQKANFPPVMGGIGLHHAAATLMKHGTPEQRRHLEWILDGEFWCQGFSEPDAGSDLASLRTSARRDGDWYVVNGQKIWSSGAQFADWCLLLARTDPSAPKHAGISVFMLDMTSEGVEVRPIRQATGDSEFCEVFLSDVRIPLYHRIGKENDGWHIAQTTLSTERASMIVGFQTALSDSLQHLCATACELDSAGARQLDRPGLRHELAQRISEVEILGMLVEQVVGKLVSHGEMGPEGSTLKIFYSETLQRLSEFGSKVHGLEALELSDDGDSTVASMRAFDVNDYVRSWAHTISAGSNEIQRNIIAERILGLPREPR